MTVTKNLCYREATKPQMKNEKVESESRHDSPRARRGFPAFVLSCTIGIFSATRDKSQFCFVFPGSSLKCDSFPLGFFSASKMKSLV